MKKAKKINPLRAIALKSTMPAKKLSAFVAKYAKTHSLNNSEATAKLLSLAASRLASLAKDNARAAKKGRPNGTKPKGRKTAKAAPARSAKAAKPKAARKPAKRAPKAKAQAAPAAATE